MKKEFPNVSSAFSVSTISKIIKKANFSYKKASTQINKANTEGLIEERSKIA